MKIVAIKVGTVRLPFRFSFKHNLAQRNYSLNIIAEVTVQDDVGKLVRGWGESVPRSYVTGETVESALHMIEYRCAPIFLGREFDTSETLLAAITNEFRNLGLETTAGGASWCALELALLDAVARTEGRPLATLLGGPRQFAQAHGVRYGGVIPFSSSRVFQLLLRLYKMAGFSTVKIKVGRKFSDEIERLLLARKILGKDAIIRIDPNCAWNAEETIAFAEAARPMILASIEQPVPGDDWQGLRRIADNIPEELVVDESLCTIDQAKRLAAEGLCRGFNIRLSKVGGFLPALAMAKIAQHHGLTCHLGAQVGESGILSAAGRTLAAVAPPFENYEGSANLFLLQRDLTRENLSFGFRGKGKLLSGPGLGISVLPDRIDKLSERSLTLVGRGSATQA
jgi:muconate cycloisomerase